MKYIKILFFFSILLVLMYFGAQNDQEVSMRFTPNLSIQVPLYVVFIFVSFAVILFITFVAIVDKLELRIENRRLTKEIKKLNQEIEKYKTLEAAIKTKGTATKPGITPSSVSVGKKWYLFWKK